VRRPLFVPNFVPAHRMEIAGTTLLRRRLINKISILTPSTQPAEPLARVAWVGEKQTTSPATGKTDRSVAGEVVPTRQPTSRRS
jgi:hypothetical protein